MTTDSTFLFFDCEFTSLTQAADLISIGIVSDDGRAFYAEKSWYGVCSEWVKETVKIPILAAPNLPMSLTSSCTMHSTMHD